MERRVKPLMAALALALVAPIAARSDGGGAIPDSARMAALRGAIARAPVLLVRGDFGLREFWHPVLDSAGVRPGRKAPPRPALFTAADAPRPAVAPPIPWREISTMQTQRPKKLQGAIVGGVLGLAVGFLILEGSQGDDDLRALGLIIGAPTTGVLLGTFLGSLSGTRTIYRAPTWEGD